MRNHCLRLNSLKISRAIRLAFQELGWEYKWDERNDVFRYPMELREPLGIANCWVRMRNDSFICGAVSPVSGNPNDRDSMAALADYFSRVNRTLLPARFALDRQSGEIVCRITVNCPDGEPSLETVKEALYVPGLLLDRFADGIMAVRDRLKSADEAAMDFKEKSDERPVSDRTDGDSLDGDTLTDCDSGNGAT